MEHCPSPMGSEDNGAHAGSKQFATMLKREFRPMQSLAAHDRRGTSGTVHAMQVKEVLTRNVAIVHPEATLQEAVEKMGALNVGLLAVCEDGDCVGVLLDADVRERLEEGANARTASVREAMRTDVVFCFDDQDIREAAKLMAERQIRWLLVLRKQFVGMVSADDIAIALHRGQLAGEITEPLFPPNSGDLTRGAA